MCNSILISPLDRFCGGTGGTGGTAQDLARAGGTAGWDRWDRRAQGDAARADRQSFTVVLSVPPIGPTKSLQNCLQYHRSHRSHPVARPSCLGDEKRL